MLFLISLAFLALFYIIILIKTALKPGVRQIPGPFLAKFTDLLRTYYAYRGVLFQKQQEWHRRYGNYVRVGPNTVMVSESDVFQGVFGARKEFPKSDFQKPWRQISNGKVFETIASTQNKRTHAELKKPVAMTFSLTNILSYEPKVMSTLKYFLRRLDQQFIAGDNAEKSCDIDNWLQYFAFDVVGEITLSRQFGFLEKGSDIDSMLQTLDDIFHYRGTVSHAPWLDQLINRNPLYLALFTPTNSFIQRAKRDIITRISEQKSDPTAAATQKDLLASYLEAQKKHPKIVSDNTISSYVTTTYLAGSDTTAIVLRSILYYTLRTPGCIKRLRADMAVAGITEFPVSYRVAHELPYLDAIIREGMRIHSVTSFGLEREVPPEVGADGWAMPNGVVLPIGSQVSFTAWTLHFDENVFGPDTHSFRPERWLRRDDEGEDEYKERLARMNRNDFTFSYGPRVCIGKNIALMEIYMTIPTLLGIFDMEFVDPSKEWEVNGAFFPKQSGMDIRLKWREGVHKEILTLD